MSNERLMSLVEKPLPKDLVGLHMSFGVVPPLVRLRGYGVIRSDEKEQQKSLNQRLK
jgi:hypothetical protein